MTKVNRLLAGAVLLLTALLSISVYTQVLDKDGFPEGRNFKDGTVWVLTFVRTPYGKDLPYLNAIADVWKKQQDALIREGATLSYKVLQPNASSVDDYNIILMVQYKDLATMEANADKQAVITQTIARRNPEAAKTLQEDGIFFGSRVVREIVLR